MIEVFGTVFIIMMGSLAHFVYDWSNHNKFLGYFFAVNESTWEHIKLIIGPSLLWFVIEIHFYSGNPSLIFVRFISLLAMCLLIPTIFYTYKAFTKKSILIVDILTFIVTVIIGETLFHYLINFDFSNPIFRHIGYIGLIVIFIKYITSTYTPSKNFYL